MKKMKWEAWNRLCLGTILGGVLLISVASEWLLYRLNENVTLTKVVEIQNNEDVLYGTLLGSQHYAYKQRMVALKQPDILVIGSSRVMSFRKEFFNSAYSFYNVGGAVPTIEKGIEFVNKMPKGYKPKLVILGVDLWWLNSNYVDRRDLQPILEEANWINKRVRLYGALLENVTNGSLAKLGIGLKTIPNLNAAKDPIEKRKAVGLLAALRGDGFRADGSWQYGSVISGALKNDFSSEKKAILEGRGVFAYGSHVDVTRLEQLRKFIQMMNKSGATVIIMAPPYAHEIFDYLEQSARHKIFMKDARHSLYELCNKEAVHFYDFSDIVSFGSNDNEALDGYHGSELCYARIMLTLSSDKRIVNYIDSSRIQAFISSKSR